LYSELRQFIREASDNLIQEGFEDLVAKEDDLDIEAALAAAERGA